MSKAELAQEVKMRPIIFSGESIKAILLGAKTQTRRVIKFPPKVAAEGTDWIRSAYQDGAGDWIFWSTDAPNMAGFTKKAYPGKAGIPCPYGRPGDRLWCRETWRSYNLDGTVEGAKQTLRYRADREEAMITWCSPILMPRWASRLTLELTEVRVEHIQQISYEDVLAEGIEPVRHGDHANQYYREETLINFARGWNRLNQQRGFGWDANPWVWVLSFRRINSP